MYIEVLFNLPIKSSFYYSIPNNLDVKDVKTGVRVSTYLGKRKLTGFIVKIFEEKPDVTFEIKPIEKIIDSSPLFDENYLELVKWTAAMYMCSEGEALFSMLPSAKKEKEFNIDIADESGKQSVIALNDGQNTAIEKIADAASGKKIFFLYGVTGSGKTEVYLKLAEYVISKGKSVIYLVPEISLTHQLTEYAVSRFAGSIAVIHSSLTASEKLNQWRIIQNGEAKIVLGARSAVFAPVKNLGLIIIDEEHESSYKSGSSPRYHARQVAMYRIKNADAKLIMGSATPSAEAYYLMQNKTIEMVELKKVAAGGTFAPVKIINMNGQNSSISPYLAERIVKITQEKSQVILFLNRRGFFYYYHCLYCGYEFKCVQCSIPLTYHKDRNKLVCHYCGYSETPSKSCPECGSMEVGYSGFGTEKIEEDIKKLFPHLNVRRVDKDSVKNSKEMKQIFLDFKNRKIDILLGTQIIAKGLNFPGVKLIGIITADTTLQLPDFRSPERTFALITQVAGRTGRFSSDGEVVIQTYRPDNSAVKFAAQRLSKEFYNREIENRRAMGFPPFSRLIRLIFRSKEGEKALCAARDIFTILQSCNKGFSILGPAECPLFIIAGNRRYHILVKSGDFKKIHSAVSYAMEKAKKTAGVYIEVDVDPVSLM